jgi:hypothetical protein
LHLGSVAPEYYVTKNNNYTITGVYTYNANLVINSPILARGDIGFAGQILASNGTSGAVYWANVADLSTSVTLDGGSF